MADVTRVNGVQCTAGTLYGLNVNLMVLTVRDTDGVNVNITAEDDAPNEVCEAIVREINPLAFFIEGDSSGGVVYLVVDRSISAMDIQHRIRLLGRTAAPTTTDGNKTFTYAVTKVGPNQVDISGTTVEDGNQFIVLG